MTISAAIKLPMTAPVFAEEAVETQATPQEKIGKQKKGWSSRSSSIPEVKPTPAATGCLFKSLVQELLRVQLVDLLFLLTPRFHWFTFAKTQ